MLAIQKRTTSQPSLYHFIYNSSAKKEWLCDALKKVKAKLEILYYATEATLSKTIVAPINNFLKDSKQIEHELALEATKEMILQGNFISHPLEENY